MNDLLNAVVSFARTILQSLWGFVRRHPFHVLTAIVMVIALNMIWSRVYTSAVREITVYVGPPGSSSYRMRERLAESIENISTTPGFHYRAVVVPTYGFVDIEQRLCDDITGRSVGLTVDGVHQNPALRTLLPLDWDYLHVLASVRFLQEVRRKSGASAWPTQFSQVVPYLSADKYARVFGGAQESGTHKFATMLFVLHGKSLDSLNDPAISNWEQAIPALKAGRLDLAFYCGPLQSTTIETVAGNGSAVLLGLDDLQDALVKNQDYSLVAESIPKNLYSAAPLDVEGEPPLSESPHPESELIIADSKTPPLYFGSRSIPTVAARRLIVTSTHMSDWDAYYITQALTDKLTENKDIPPNTWQRKSPDAAPAGADSDFGIRTHHGAALHRDKKGIVSWWQPDTWDSTTRSVAFGLLTLFATTLLQASVQWLQRGASAPPVSPTPTPAAPADAQPKQPAPATASAAEGLQDQCEALLEELLQLPETISAGERRRVAERLRALRADIRAQVRDQRISRDQAYELFEAHRKLQAELLAISPETEEAGQA